VSALPAVAHCGHCGAALASARPYCCAGCELAAAIISGAGLDRYYAERTAFAPRPAPIPGLAALPVTRRDDRRVECRLAIDGLRCASCVWVVEKVLEHTEGVVEARVSYGSGRATVAFDPARTDVATVAGRIAALGYRPRAPADPASDAGDRDLLVRLGVAAFCSANVMMASIAIYAGWADGMDERFATLFRWTALLVSTPAAVWCAQPFFGGAIRGVRSGALSMDLPIALGIAILYGSGIVATFAGYEAYFDSLTMLVALLLGGRVLESRGRRRAREAAESLAAVIPRTARRVTGARVETVPSDSLVPGDALEVGTGEEIAADGRVAHGEAQVAMALLTGESAPQAVRAGDPVYAGAIVASGAIRVTVEAAGGRTLVDRMTEELRQAADRPAATGLPDRIAPAFTAATLGIAAATFSGWWALAGAAAAIAPTVAVLVVACPCALALAQPLAVASGLGAAARRGVLVRSGDALLRLAEIDTVILDKTGTLTEGEPVVCEAEDADLRLAAGLERSSVHPVARAIVAAAIARGIPLPDGTDIAETPGVGIRGRVDGQRVEVRAGGAGTILVVSDGRIGAIALRDAVRPDSARTVAALRTAGLAVAMCSGDRPEVARAIAAEAGIDDVCAGIDPAGKRALVDARRAAGATVLFAGDGINDGPALAAADVGVAMGTGASSTVCVADAVIAENRLAPLLAAIRAGRAARSVIRGNLARSLTYNALAVAAAALGFVNPLVAAVLMPLSSTLVVWGAAGVERRVAREERWTA
jgi:Cu2+-exporting ATPase